MTTVTTDSSGVDVSGPCDEAEHADDPRCTGSTGDDATVDDREDNSGPGSVDDDDDADEDNSGSGSVDDDDDPDEDNSGSGSGSDD